MTVTEEDILHHYIANPHLAASLPYDSTTKAHGPVTITVSAVDEAGNEAEPVVLPLYITTVDAACADEEFMCESGSCSAQGLCLQHEALLFLAASGLLPSSSMPSNSMCEGTGAATASANIHCYDPVYDHGAPVVTALGEPPDHSRVAGRRPGQIILESSFNVDSPYIDAGAIAFDYIDRDVSSSLSKLGLSLVDTRAPTVPGIPYVVSYSAYDSSRNFAEPAERHVLVQCTGQSLTCTLSDGSTYCSVSDTQCLEPSPLVSLERDYVAPVVSLIGPAEIRIIQGTPYGACRERSPLEVHCDRGAEAHSSVEGDITWAIMACAQGFSFVKYGLQGCGLDTSVVGGHVLSFFVTHGDLQIAANRTVWVLERCFGTYTDGSLSILALLRCPINSSTSCSGSEVHCKDGSCSVDGACSSGYAELVLPVNTPPELELFPAFAAGDDGVVQVPRGWLYKYCEAGFVGSVQEPCEPGAADPANPMKILCRSSTLAVVLKFHRHMSSDILDCQQCGCILHTLCCCI